MVMTDWTSGTDWVNQMYAGNEMIMPGEKKQAEELLKAVRDGRLDEKVLDENVSCILEYILKTPRFKEYHYSNKPNLKANALVALQAAEEGMVLLKNDQNTLPFKKVKEVALFGKTSYHFITGGTGSGEVNYNHAVSLQEGLENAKYKLTVPLKNQYVNIIDSVLSKKIDSVKTVGGKRKFAIDRMNEINLSDELINSSVKTSDIAIITLGRTTGEGSDRKENDYFALSAAEQDMIRKVCNAYHAAKKKVVVVLNIGGPIETESWKNYPDAIFLAWQTGQEGGNAIAEILSGKVNPSGKTAQTFPVKYADVPSSSTFPGEPSENPINSFYNDGIYVGYRYYDSFDVKPSYEFGYGLSYTTFKYSDLKLSSPTFNDKMDVTVTITNTGKVAGKEVVQLYLSAPQDKIEKPVQELKGFAKTKLLKPNESQTLTFTLDGRALASYWSGISTWVADAGKYEVKIGASSRDIKATASFSLDKSTIVEKEHYVLYPDRYVKEISVKDKK
jgi:beta-glucosidase